MGGFQFQPKQLVAVVIAAFLIVSDNPATASALHPYVNGKVIGSSTKMVPGRGSSYGHVSLDLESNHNEVEGSSFLRLRSLAAKRVAPAPPPPPMKNQKTSMRAFSPPPLLE